MRLVRKQHLSFYDYVPSFGEPGQGLRVLKVLAIAVAPVAAEPIVGLEEGEISYPACHLTNRYFSGAKVQFLRYTNTYIYK